MRDPKRIDDILAAIKDIWKQNPDLRLGQLITNVIDEDVLYYIEDDILKKKLVAYYFKKLDN